MSDLVKQEWPREIWMAELGENHNGTGMVVLSEFATVPRWEGDDERDCDFQRYVDADILESSERYHKHMLATQAERIERLEASQEELAAVLRRALSESTNGSSDLWVPQARAVLAKLEKENRDGKA